MSLTEEESNFLRFYFLNVKTASKAVRAYFDTLYPSSKLASELKINYLYWKKLPFITSHQRNILYPGSGNIVKSEQFDITLMICLLRNMQPCLVPNAPPTGWGNLPKPTNTNYRADLARVKYYRNFVAHHKTGELSASNFTQYWRDLEQAIGRLGGSSIHTEAQSVRHVILDTSLTDMLLELRNFEKSLHEQSDKINNHQSAIDSIRSNKEKQEQKIHQLNVSHQHMEAETQKLTTQLSDYKGTIDSCTKDIETCEKGIESNTEMIKELQDQLGTKQNEVDNLITKVVKLEIRYEQQNKMYDGQIDTLVKKIDDMKQNLHNTGHTLVRGKQKRLEDVTKALLEEDIREDTFVTTKAVTDGLLLLQQNGVLLITGHAGTGKSRIGRHVLHMFCTDDISYQCIKLNTLEEWEDMVNREENMAVLIDDIFGETNCIYNREKAIPILDKVYSYLCKTSIKVIITIRNTVKHQCQELFESHRLFKFYFIDLSSNKYVLSRTEKKDLLTNYMKTARLSVYTDNKGFLDDNGDTILNEKEVRKITVENPAKGFPLVVYQFVHNEKYFKLASIFFDRPTETILEEINAIRRQGKEHMKFRIQYAVMVFTAINENCINPDDTSNITEISNIIEAIYGVPTEMKKCNILDAVKELKGSYFINITNQRSYRLHHPTLQESVILSFAEMDEENMNKIIPLISWSFFLKMVKPESYIEKEGEVVLRCSAKSFKVLADRLVDIYVAEFRTYILYGGVEYFILGLCNTEIFHQEYNLLLPCLLKASEKEDNKDKHAENMVRCATLYKFHYYLEHMKNTEIFIAYLLETSAASESRSNIYKFVLKTFNTIIKTSSSYFTIDYMQTALISSLYGICSAKDVGNVKATLDIIEEHNIPVLLDQGVRLTNIANMIPKVHEDSETCVYLILCVWKAYEVFNIPVLEVLLLRYNQTPFDINLFFKMIYREEWIWKEIQLVLGKPLLSFEPLKWMIESFQDQDLDDPNSILKTACKYQMFDTVQYLSSGCKTFDAVSCLQSFIDKPDDESIVRNIPFNQELLNFLITKKKHHFKRNDSCCYVTYTKT